MAQEKLTIVCAWCNTTVERGGERISHGICVDCAMSFLARLPAEYLQSVADPGGTVTLFSGYTLPIEGRSQPA